jgi:hypothetical protein
MKSVDQALFRSLRRQARKSAHSSPSLWKEYKRRRRARPGGRNILPPWLQKWLWPFAMVVFVPALAPRLGMPLLLALLALYCSGTVFLRAAGLRSRLYSSIDLFVALHFPVGDDAFFSWQIRGWLASLFPLTLISGFIYYWSSLDRPLDSAFWLAATLAALLQTLSVAAFSLAAVLYRSRVSVNPALVFYGLIGIGLAFPTALADSARTLVLFLPAGWFNALFAYGFSHAETGIPLLLFALGTFAVLDYYLLRSLRASYPQSSPIALLERRFDEETPESDSHLVQAVDSAEPLSSDYIEAREQFSAARNRRKVEAGIAAPLFDWESGNWMIRLAGRWMTSRERVVVTFLRAGRLDVSRNRWRFTAAMAATTVLICVLRVDLPIAMPLITSLVAAISFVPIFGGSWPGWSPSSIGFMSAAPAGGYPISYREASLAISKCNAPFFLGFLPFALLMGAAMGWRFLDSASDGAIYSVQTVLLLLAIQPYCTMLIHSQSTNDTRGFNLTSLSLMAALILNILVFLPAAVVFFIGHRHPLAWAICPLVMFLMPSGMWRFYEFLYNRGRIDLLANAR